MNVLVVVAHPDDELIGCGATVRRLADEGHRIFSCVLSANAEARHNRPSAERLREVSRLSSTTVGIQDSVLYEFRNIELNVVPHIELVRAVEAAVVKFVPDWVFTHHPGDLNIDHRVCYEATMAAVTLPQRLSSSLSPHLVRRVYLCEVPSSTDWSFEPAPHFRPNSFFDVTRTFDAKVAALQAFEGALKPHPHSRSLENIEALARVRGGQIHVPLAEAFSLVRDVN